jgi:hypothetical protein
LSEVISEIPVHDIKRVRAGEVALTRLKLFDKRLQKHLGSSAFSVLALCGIQSTKIYVPSSIFAPQLPRMKG